MHDLNTAGASCDPTLSKNSAVANSIEKVLVYSPKPILNKKPFYIYVTKKAVKAVMKFQDSAIVQTADSREH